MADGRHFENSISSISQPIIIRFRSNLVGRCTSQFPWWTFNKKSKLCKFNMAYGRHTENRFLAISRHHIGRSKRNLEQRWKITCRYRSRDQNCNFRKFKMADGRHFENSCISAVISPISTKFGIQIQIPSRTWKFHTQKKNRNFSNSRWHIENRFLAISQRHIGQFMQISEWSWRITGRYRSLDQSGNFRKLKMAEGHHFENSFISISQSELSDFEQIWYADVNFHSGMAIWQKIEIFQIQDGGRTPYWKSFFGYISAPYWPIDATFRKEMKNHMPIQVTWDQNCNFPKFKMAEGRHFENSFRCLRHSCNELMLSIVFQ